MMQDTFSFTSPRVEKELFMFSVFNCSFKSRWRLESRGDDSECVSIFIKIMKVMTYILFTVTIPSSHRGIFATYRKGLQSCLLSRESEMKFLQK